MNKAKLLSRLLDVNYTEYPNNDIYCLELHKRGYIKWHTEMSDWILTDKGSKAVNEALNILN